LQPGTPEVALPHRCWPGGGNRGNGDLRRCKEPATADRSWDNSEGDLQLIDPMKICDDDQVSGNFPLFMIVYKGYDKDRVQEGITPLPAGCSLAFLRVRVRGLLLRNQGRWICNCLDSEELRHWPDELRGERTGTAFPLFLIRCRSARMVYCLNSLFRIISIVV